MLFAHREISERHSELNIFQYVNIFIIAGSILSFIIMYCTVIMRNSENYGALSYVIDYSLYDSTRVLSVATYDEIRSSGRSWPTLLLIM